MSRFVEYVDRSGQLWELDDRKWFFQTIIKKPDGSLSGVLESKLYMEHTRIFIIRSAYARNLGLLTSLDPDVWTHVCLIENAYALVSDHALNNFTNLV